MKPPGRPRRRKRVRQRGGCIKRGRPPRRRGGSLFPKARCKSYWDWCGEQIAKGRPCDGCGKVRAAQRCHVIPRSQGGPDLDNIVWLGSPFDCDCDARSEKRYEAFKAETGVDLLEPAQDHTREWVNKTHRERDCAF